MDLAYRTPEEEIAASRPELAAARAQLGTAAVAIEHLRAQLAALRRQQYGQSSERLDAEIAQLELPLEDLEENEAEHQAARPDPDAASGQSRSRAKPSVDRCQIIYRARPWCMSPHWCAAAATGADWPGSA